MFDRSGWLRMFSLLGLMAGLSGCAQGEGEPCQVDEDCSAGLGCNANGNARGECVTSSEDEDVTTEESTPTDDEDAGS